MRCTKCVPMPPFILLHTLYHRHCFVFPIPIPISIPINFRFCVFLCQNHLHLPPPPKNFLIERDSHCLHFVYLFVCVRFFGCVSCVRFKNFLVNNNQNMASSQIVFVWVCVVFFRSVSFQFNALLKSKIPIKKSYFPMMMMVTLLLLLLFAWVWVFCGLFHFHRVFGVVVVVVSFPSFVSFQEKFSICVPIFIEIFITIFIHNNLHALFPCPTLHHFKWLPSSIWHA